MQLKVALITVTLTILTRLNAIQSLPIESGTHNVLEASQNFVPFAPTGSPLSKLQGDSRNQNPPRSSIRHDTQVRPIVPETSVNLLSSQVSNIRPASQVLSNTGQPLLVRPPGPTRNVQQNQPVLDHRDHLVEGSGAGPPSSKEEHKSKLDDTDDSTDDGDDEDYDDVDSPHGSIDQLAHVPASVRKPNSLSEPMGGTNNKPDYDNFYRPFRPAVTRPSSLGNINPINNQTRPTTSSPTFVPTSSLPMAHHLQPSLSRQPMSNATFSASVPAQRFPPVPRNKTDTDYDYAAESDDDEMEEASVFEDNDNDELELAANKTQANLSQTSPSLSTAQISQPKGSSPQRGVLSNTSLNLSQEQSAAKIQPPKTDLFATAIRPIKPDTSSTRAAQQNLTTTSRPIVEQVTPSNHPIEESEEGEDDEDEEEEFEEEDDENPEMEEDGSDEEAPSERPLSTPSPLPYPPRPSPGPPSATQATVIVPDMLPNGQTSQHRPVTIAPFTSVVARNNTRAPTVPQAIPANTSLGGRAPGFSPTTGPSALATSSSDTLLKVSLWSAVDGPTTRMPLTSTISMTNSPPSVQSISLFTTLRPHTLPNPSTGGYRPEVTSAPRQTTSAPSAPRQPPTTARPSLTSPAYPTKRVAPALTTNVEPYDSINLDMGNNDDSLTRQIYDKAKEAYLEVDRTLRAALDAVWPPNFNFDSNSLEPLLTQPVLFMLALGGAIICLVLLMMLVVYMISYQTKPRRYELDDISIY